MQTLRPLVGNLRSIHVHWNTCITDGFLVWLAKSLPGLEVRVVEKDCAVTAEAIVSLRSIGYVP